MSTPRTVNSPLLLQPPKSYVNQQKSESMLIEGDNKIKSLIKLDKEECIIH